MRKLIVLFILLAASVSFSIAEAKQVKKYFHRADHEMAVDSLREYFGEHKIMPEEYELEILIALSYFPELRDVNIIFLPKKIKTTMACRPSMDAIFKDKEKRVYRIFINNLLEGKNGVNYDDVPFNARIGLVGHELGHVVDYMQKSMLRIIGNGIGYVMSDTYRKSFEANVDKITVERGLGWQQYAFASFVRNKANVNESYLEFKENNYPSPKRFKGWMQKFPDLYPLKTIEKTFGG